MISNLIFPVFLFSPCKFFEYMKIFVRIGGGLIDTRVFGGDGNSGFVVDLLVMIGGSVVVFVVF